MVFQPQKPQGFMWNFGDILLSMLASLFPLFLTSIIALGYKRKKKNPTYFLPSFLHHVSPQQEPKPVSCAYHLEPAAVVGRRQAPGQLPVAVPVPALIFQPLLSAPSVAAVQSWALSRQEQILEGKQWSAYWSCWSLLQKNPTEQCPKYSRTSKALFCASS